MSNNSKHNNWNDWRTNCGLEQLLFWKRNLKWIISQSLTTIITGQRWPTMAKAVLCAAIEAIRVRRGRNCHHYHHYPYHRWWQPQQSTSKSHHHRDYDHLFSPLSPLTQVSLHCYFLSSFTYRPQSSAHRQAAAAAPLSAAFLAPCLRVQSRSSTARWRGWSSTWALHLHPLLPLPLPLPTLLVWRP